MKMHSIMMTAVLASGSLAVAAQADLLAYWNFNDLDIPGTGTTNVPGDGNVPLSISADAGTGDLSLADWGGSVQDFAGSTLNALFGDASGASLSLQHGSGGLDGNGTWIEFSISMSGYENLQLSWAGRGTGSGFSSNQVSYSTDGVTFIDFGGPYDSTQTSFELYEFDFGSLLDDANDVTIRITFDGATTAAGNNRLDNVQFNATLISPDPVAVSLNADDDCYGEGIGDTVSVSIDLSGDGVTEVVGGQFFMEYDPTVLEFVSAEPGDSPFSLEIYEFHVMGIIDYAVGVGHGESGTTGDATLAVLTFTTLQEGCDVSSLVQFRPNSPPTRLVDDFGAEVLPDLADLGQITIDGTAPVLSIPSDWTAECDEATDPASTGGFATAVDNCDNEPDINFSDVVDLSGCGGYTGTITRTWIATDACGNVATQDQIITIEDTTAPVLTIPGDILVYADAGTCEADLSPANFLTGEALGDGTSANLGAEGFELTVTENEFGYAFVRLHIPDGIELQDITSLSYSSKFTDPITGGGSLLIMLNIDADDDGALTGTALEWAIQGFDPAVLGGDNFLMGDGFLYITNPETSFSWHDALASSMIYWCGNDDRDNLSNDIFHEFFDIVPGMLPVHDIEATSMVYSIDFSVHDPWADGGTVVVNAVELNGSTYTAGGSAVGVATATDNCDPSPVITAVRSDSLPLTDPYPAGITTITWTATDACGNSASDTQTIEVIGDNQMIADVSIEGLSSVPSLERCMTFELIPTGGGTPVVVQQTVELINGEALGVVVDVPCGDYECITARDPLHTLANTGDINVDGTLYVADNFGDLLQGDLNDDGLIDILDFGIYVWQTGVNYGFIDTPCGTAAPHADMSGSGNVSTADFTFISNNFLEVDETCPITLMAGQLRRSQTAPQPRTSVTVQELHRMGLGHLEVADLNGDGVIDALDFAAFLHGVRP